MQVLKFPRPTYVAFIFGALISSSAFANVTTTVDHIETSAGNVTAYFTLAPENPAQCAYGISGASHNGLAISVGDPGNKNYLAILMAAKLAGRPVMIQTDPNNCIWGGWPVLIDVQLY